MVLKGSGIWNQIISIKYLKDLSLDDWLRKQRFSVRCPPIFGVALPDPSHGLAGYWAGKWEVEVGSDWVLTRLLDKTHPTFSMKNSGII